MSDQSIVDKICKDAGWEDPCELKPNWYASCDKDMEPLVIELQKSDRRVNYYKWSGSIEY